MSAIVNAAGLALSLWSIGDLLKGEDVDPDKLVSVSVVTGAAPNAGGSIPHLAVWDEHGNRIGQYKGDENGHINEQGTKSFTVSPDQNGGKQAIPDYLLMVMQESDALCVSAIVVSGGSYQRVWTGDMAYTCGAQWYHSKASYGNSNAPVRCAWFDADHSNGIIAKGLSLHMESFSSDPGLLKQYKQNQKRLCQNTRRMTFHEDIVPDALVPYFDPPLEYNAQGGMKSPNRGIDRKTRAYPDGTFDRKHARDLMARNVTSSVKGLKNNAPDLLIISNQDGHSAKELCDHPMSLGPDFVDVPEKLFCDMETGKVWPLCEDASSESCFDLDAKQMRQSLGSSKGAAKFVSPVKQYKSHEEW
ncbi:hypothetical protein BDW68DRAFT_181140 [Aspergillus falconensis]